MNRYEEFVSNSIENRNIENNNINEMKDYCVKLKLQYTAFGSGIEKSKHFYDLVKLFESYGIIKPKYALMFAKELIAHCMALQPMPDHLRKVLELFSKMRSSGLTHPVDLEGCSYSDFGKTKICLKEISQSLIKEASESYIEALDVQIALYVQEMI